MRETKNQFTKTQGARERLISKMLFEGIIADKDEVKDAEHHGLRVIWHVHKYSEYFSNDPAHWVEKMQALGLNEDALWSVLAMGSNQMSRQQFVIEKLSIPGFTPNNGDYRKGMNLKKAVTGQEAIFMSEEDIDDALQGLVKSLGR